MSEKNPEKFFMSEKIYHIYARGECIYHSLSKAEFDITWEALRKLVEIFSEYQREDLSFEEVVSSKQEFAESSY